MREEIRGGREAGLEVGRCGEKHVPVFRREGLETDIHDGKLVKGLFGVE